ncbi:hypothetical protein ST47_g510 [Ascochyta rabiei]|uniref:Uncharacterized protein n=1 Tax=Didymella rabiei TaxID=5454 RepID=A0A163M2D2_DIDRA|nr:hypothetical protein ST47_g510 [Ascochyta rabiei]
MLDASIPSLTPNIASTSSKPGMITAFLDPPVRFIKIFVRHVEVPGRKLDLLVARCSLLLMTSIGCSEDVL